MKIGFSGTRGKLTYHQAVRLHDLLHRLVVDELHHGACIGTDAYAAGLAHTRGMLVVSHPPSNPRYRDFSAHSDYTMPEKPYLARNHDIVDATEGLIACPDGPETLRSGTWATVRYARKKGKPVEVVLP